MNKTDLYCNAMYTCFCWSILQQTKFPFLKIPCFKHSRFKSSQFPHSQFPIFRIDFSPLVSGISCLVLRMVLSLFCCGFVSCCRGFGCFAVSWVCSAITLGCLAVTSLCFVDVSFVGAVTPVDHRSLELRTKINRAPGIPSYWSRDPGSAMLFLPESKLRKYSNINVIVWFISYQGPKGPSRFRFKIVGFQGPRPK